MLKSLIFLTAFLCIHFSSHAQFRYSTKSKKAIKLLQAAQRAPGESLDGQVLIFNSSGMQEYNGVMSVYTKVKLSPGVHFARYQFNSGKTGTVKFVVD